MGDFQLVSLYGFYEQLIALSVKDLWTASDGHVVDARAAVPERGRKRELSYVEIIMSRLRPVPWLRELNEVRKAKVEYGAKSTSSSIRRWLAWSMDKMPPMPSGLRQDDGDIKRSTQEAQRAYH